MALFGRGGLRAERNDCVERRLRRFGLRRVAAAFETEALDRRWWSRIDREGETGRHETNLVDNIERLLRG